MEGPEHSLTHKKKYTKNGIVGSRTKPPPPFGAFATKTYTNAHISVRM